MFLTIMNQQEKSIIKSHKVLLDRAFRIINSTKPLRGHSVVKFSWTLKGQLESGFSEVPYCRIAG